MSKALDEITGHKVAGLTMDLMSKLRDGVIPVAHLESFLTMPVQERQKMFGTTSSEVFLKIISGGETVKLDSVKGNVTIADSKNVFTYIDGDFKNWKVNTSSDATPETRVDVYEMTKDATFTQMFGSLCSDLDTLCFTQHQIVNFVTKHRNWLRTEGYGTFFLFKSDEQFFVAFVHFPDGGSLEVGVRRFEYPPVWLASNRRRLVAPQLSTL